MSFYSFLIKLPSVRHTFSIRLSEDWVSRSIVCICTIERTTLQSILFILCSVTHPQPPLTPLSKVNNEQARARFHGQNLRHVTCAKIFSPSRPTQPLSSVMMSKIWRRGSANERAKKFFFFGKMTRKIFPRKFLLIKKTFSLCSSAASF